MSATSNPLPALLEPEEKSNDPRLQNREFISIVDLAPPDYCQKYQEKALALFFESIRGIYRTHTNPRDILEAFTIFMFMADNEQASDDVWDMQWYVKDSLLRRIAREEGRRAEDVFFEFRSLSHIAEELCFSAEYRLKSYATGRRLLGFGNSDQPLDDIFTTDKGRGRYLYTYTDIIINPTVDDIVNKGD